MSGIQIGTSDVINSNREFDNITGADGKYDGLHGRLVGSLSGNAINMSVPMTRHVMTGDATFTLTGISPGATCMLLLDRSADLHTPTFPSAISFPTNPTWENWRYWQIVLTCPRGTQVTGNAIGFLWSGVNGEAPGGASIDATFTRPSGWLYSNRQIVASVSNSTVFVGVGIYFVHDPSNNRILVRFGHSSSQAIETANDVYINYTNLTNITNIEFMYKYSDVYAEWDHDGGDETPNVGSPTNFENWHGPGPIPEYDDITSGTSRGVDPNTWTTFYPSNIQGNTLTGSWRKLIWKAGAVHESNVQGNGYQSRVGVAWGSSISDNLSVRVTCDEGQFISTCDLGNTDTVGNTQSTPTDPVNADITLLAVKEGFN